MTQEKKVYQTAIGALRYAIQQIGQQEQPRGSNKGPMVNEYLAAVGLQPGYAWCQAFVYWCYENASKDNGSENPVVRTAGVYDCWNKSKGNPNVHRRCIEPTEIPQPGDQFILLFSNGSGHTGIVEHIDTSKEVPVLHTIEGNSNASGGREGFAVVRRERRADEPALTGYIRYL